MTLQQIFFLRGINLVKFGQNTLKSVQCQRYTLKFANHLQNIRKKILKKRNNIHSFQSFIDITFVKMKLTLSASQFKEI